MAETDDKSFGETPSPKPENTAGLTDKGLLGPAGDPAEGSEKIVDDDLAGER